MHARGLLRNTVRNTVRGKGSGIRQREFKRPAVAVEASAHPLGLEEGTGARKLPQSCSS